MDARTVGVGAIAMQRGGKTNNPAGGGGGGHHKSSSHRSNLITAGNVTWCPEIDYLADGVTSSVYRCRDINTGDFYAVKVFKSVVPGREVDLLQKLKHENIVRLITSIRFRDNLNCEKYGLVLEYCPGNSLHEYLKQPDNKLGLPDRDFLALLYNMCDGLAYLREQLKIVHRDIKPGNIMISYDSRHQPVFKLADFGCARELEDGGDFQSLVGTFEFLHPSIYTEVYHRMHASIQQRTGGSPGHKPECDLWSLGVTLYMAATGRLPFAPFEGVRGNHAKMIEMMVNKPPNAISATQPVRSGNIEYHDRLPPTCPLSRTLQQLLVELLRGIMVSDFRQQWTFPCFFETVTRHKSQHCSYYFVAGGMLLPDLVFSPKQSFDSLLTSLASVTGYAKEEIVVFYRSQAVSAFPTGSTHTSPVIVLSKKRFQCTLDIDQLNFDYINARPRQPNANEPKEVKDFVDEAHRQALVCRQLANACHLNHALTLEAKDATLCLMDKRGRDAYQRVSAKIAMVSSSQQKVGRLMEMAGLVKAQTGCQVLTENMSAWQRELESIRDRVRVDLQQQLQQQSHQFEGNSRDDDLFDSGSGGASLVPSQELAAYFNSVFARLLAPRQSAECLSVAFHRVEQVYERYSHMITKFMHKHAQQLADLMRHSFSSSDQILLDRSLDECQTAVRTCCVETLTSVRNGLADWMHHVHAEVERLERLEEGLRRQDVDSELDMLHDKVYRGIFDALAAYFDAHKASKESDLDGLSKTIQDLLESTGLVQNELERNTQLLKELDALGLQNSGMDSQASSDQS